MTKAKLNLPELSLRALNELPVAILWFDKNGDFFAVNDQAC